MVAAHITAGDRAGTPHNGPRHQSHAGGRVASCSSKGLMLQLTLVRWRLHRTACSWLAFAADWCICSASSCCLCLSPSQLLCMCTEVCTSNLCLQLSGLARAGKHSVPLEWACRVLHCCLLGSILLHASCRTAGRLSSVVTAAAPHSCTSGNAAAATGPSAEAADGGLCHL